MIQTSAPFAVLVVDGTPFRGQLVARLRSAGVVAAQASCPEQARTYLRNLRFDVVLVDVDDDAGRARRFLDEVRRAQPGARRVGISQHGAQLAGLDMLCKPFGVEALFGRAA